MKKDVPAYILRMEKANDEDGFHCSGFAAKAMARDYREMRQEITELREVVSRIGAATGQASLSAASSIVDAWDEWEAEAGQAAQRDQSDITYRQVLMDNIVSVIERELKWSSEEDCSVLG